VGISIEDIERELGSLAFIFLGDFRGQYFSNQKKMSKM
jgi:hypothetical protein